MPPWPAVQPGNRPSAWRPTGAPIVVARLNADAAVWRFKAEVMAEVRSIEQQYWSLAQQHVQLWSSEKAVELAEEILKREQSELEVGRGTVADVAEAEQRLEQFRLDLVTKTSDVITTERQLRNLLGLPPADDRRIVPVTAPTEARLEPDWDASLAQMLTFQPDIVQQQLIVRVRRASAPHRPQPAPAAVEPERPLSVQRPWPHARPVDGRDDRQADPGDRPVDLDPAARPRA